MIQELEKKYPPIGCAIFLIFMVLSFIYCPEWKTNLEQAILPNIEGWSPRALTKVAIVVAFVIPLFIGSVLVQIKNSCIRVIGMLFGGIAMGIVFRICWVLIGVLFPFG